MVERTQQQSERLINLTVTVANHEVTQENYCNYIIKVVCPGHLVSFEIKDRYSSLREFTQAVITIIGSDAKGIPSFPKKTLWGNMEPNFIEQRKLQLQDFLNAFFSHHLVITCLLVPAYFHDKSTSFKSKQAIKNLDNQLKLIRPGANSL